jgi:hypothetical protein
VLKGALVLVGIPGSGAGAPTILVSILAPGLGDGPGRTGYELVVGFEEGAVGAEVAELLETRIPLIRLPFQLVVGVGRLAFARLSLGWFFLFHVFLLSIYYEPRSLSGLSVKPGVFVKHPAQKDSRFGRNAVRFVVTLSLAQMFL